MTPISRPWLAALAALMLVPAASFAHGLDPALLTLRETAPGRFEVLWKSSALRLPGAQVQPHLPDRCRDVSPRVLSDEGDRVRLQWTVECGDTGLAGAAIGVDDLGPAAIAALLRIEQRDGTQIETVLSARNASFVVPAQPSRAELWRHYLQLGCAHILHGPEPLFFILGLLLLVWPLRRVVQTVTAFTLGYSITLSVAALQLAAVPTRPIELLIASGVLLLAVELARGPDTRSLLRRTPWVIALGFGLLHGFAFAGALTDAGLPSGQIPLALFAFNLGLDVGQLAFVGAVLAGAALLARRSPRLVLQARLPIVYTMGILAVFWCLQRTAAWLG